MGVEAKQEISKRIIEKRKFAIDTLNDLQKPHAGMVQKDFIDMTLRRYGLESEVFDDLGSQEAFDLAMSFLAHDLLIQTFYNANGGPTGYGKAVLKRYPLLDIYGYEYSGIDAASFFKHLAGNLFFIEEGDFNNDPVVLIALYLNAFGEHDEYPPILIAPGEIRINKNYIRIDHPTGFIPPWGGSESIVTVYKLPWHHIPKNTQRSRS